MVSYKSNKKYKLKDSIACNILFILFLLTIILLYILFNKKFTKFNTKNKFEDTPTTTKMDLTISRSHTIPFVERATLPGCNAKSDVVDFCSNYESCCSGDIANVKCFCENPTVKLCKSQYDTCMSDTTSNGVFTPAQIADKCSAQNKTCCQTYKTVLDNNKFQSPIKRSQNDNIICQISALPNNEQKCLELCQNHPDCASYAVSQANCKLFYKVTDYAPPIDPLTAKPILDPNIDYYIKKV